MEKTENHDILLVNIILMCYNVRLITPYYYKQPFKILITINHLSNRHS